MFNSPEGTYSVPVSGPSQALAMLRLLALKAQRVATAAWSRTVFTVRLAGSLPRSVAAAVAGTLATASGYTLAANAIRVAATTCWSAVNRVARFIGRAGRYVGGTVTRLVGYVSPAGADACVHATDRIANRVTTIAVAVDTAVLGLGDLTWTLLTTRLVRSTVTTTAGLAAGVFVVHTMSQGLVAAKVVAALPHLMTAVVWVTNPWLALAGVVAAGGIAMAVALARLLTARANEPTPPPVAGADVHPDGPQPQVPDPVVDVETVDAQVDLDAVAASLRIEISTGGSVVVHGIPDGIPRRQGEAIARIATEAAVKQLRRTRPVRPTPSRDDRRLFTKAAREALRAEAQRRRPDSPAAA